MFDWIITRLLGALVAPDPIDHPDIRALSMRDLADMPLPRHSLPPHPQPVARFAPSWGKTALSPPLRLSAK